MNDDFFDLAFRSVGNAASMAMDVVDSASLLVSAGEEKREGMPAAIEGSRGRNFASTDILELERRFNKLALGTQAMWELLRDRYGLSEDDLKGKVLEIDLRDGRTDGKMNTLITECPQCRSKTNSRRPNCIMCGALLEKTHVFEF